MRKFVTLSNGPRQLKAKSPLLAALLFILPLLVLFLYRVQLLEANAYEGFVDIDIDPVFVCIYLLWLGVMASSYPREIRYPSDIFLALYIVTVGLCGAAFWGCTGLLGPLGALLLLGFIGFPVVAVKITRWSCSRILKKSFFTVNLFPERLLPVGLIIFLMVAGISGYMISGGDGGFDISSMYVRRLAGRDNFAGASLASYLMAMSVNSIAPLLAYIGARTRNFAYIVAAVIFVIFGFWLLGLKAPVLYVAVMYVIGTAFRNGTYRKISRYIVFSLAIIFVVAVIENLIFGYSFVADYFIRRLYLVGAQIQTYFIHKIFYDASLHEMLFGLNLHGTGSPSFLVGLEYFGNEATNANTNAFLYALALSGLVGYFLCVTFICFFMLIMDNLFISQKRGDILAVAVIYAILILEQAYTTAFISSGVFASLLLIMWFSKVPHPSKKQIKGST